jgi:dihydrofolate reductase
VQVVRVGHGAPYSVNRGLAAGTLAWFLELTVRYSVTGHLRSGMVKLIYVANVSLDGYIEDAQGGFDWTEPSDEYFAFITDLVRPCGTYLYGRRLYETMAVWETQPALAAESELSADFASVWQAADKIVYSTTLSVVSTANTRLERRFDPDAVRDVKASVASDLTVGGANLAAHAFNAGLVDECHLFVYPVLVGAGKSAFPRDTRVPLELRDERRFDNGVVYLRYRTQR